MGEAGSHGDTPPTPPTTDPTTSHEPAAPVDADSGTATQGMLFDDGAVGALTARDDVGYRGPTACAAAGITYRQLDYWARTRLVEPSVRTAAGSGTQRLYSFRDILVLKVVKRLLDTGVSLQNIRTAVGALRQRGVADLAEITLMSDGTSVYEFTSPDEVVDLLSGGQAVFAIALGRVVRDVEGSLTDLPFEHADAPAEADSGSEGTVAERSVAELTSDELSQRRRRRSTG